MLPLWTFTIADTTWMQPEVFKGGRERQKVILLKSGRGERYALLNEINGMVIERNKYYIKIVIASL